MNRLAIGLQFVMGYASLFVLPLSAAMAQQPDEAMERELKPMPIESRLQIEGEKQLPTREFDGGANVGSRANIGRRGASRVKSQGMTIRGRVRTTLLGDRNRDVKIIEDPSRGIMMEVTRHYSSKQLAVLKGKYPELSDFVDLFPTEIGDEEIELTISFKQKYKARDASELKTKSLDAFQIYRRHIKINGDHLAKLRKQSP